MMQPERGVYSGGGVFNCAFLTGDTYCKQLKAVLQIKHNDWL